MFVGREREIKAMQDTLRGHRRPSQAILVFGKKGIGKTALVKELLKDTPHKTVWFKAAKRSVVDSTQDLARACVEAGVIPPGGEYRDFEDLFEEISNTPGIYNIVIDDYHNIGYKERQEYRDSVFQCSIDMSMQLITREYPGTILLFLIGTGYQMRRLLYYSMPLYGRMDRIIRLQDLSYKEAAAFYPDHSPQDKLLMYSAFGGSPRMNRLVNPDLSAENNIIALLKGKELDKYAKDMLRNVRDKGRRDPEIHELLKALADGELFLMSRVPTFLHEDVCPYLQKRHLRLLYELHDADLLEERTYEMEESYGVKTIRYEFRDMTLRFWYRHLYDNRPLLDKLGAEEFYRTQIAPSLHGHLERVFELVCLEYIHSLDREDMGWPELWWPSLFTGKEKAGEYMYIGDERFLYIPLCLEGKAGRETLEKCLRRLKKDGLSPSGVGFISLNGFEPDCEGIPNLITGEDLYRD